MENDNVRHVEKGTPSGIWGIVGGAIAGAGLLALGAFAGWQQGRREKGLAGAMQHVPDAIKAVGTTAASIENLIRTGIFVAAELQRDSARSQPPIDRAARRKPVVRKRQTSPEKGD